MKRLVMLAGMATLTIGLAACTGGPTLGQPTAAPTGGASSAGQDTAPVSPSSSAGGLPVSQPCSLVSAAQLSELGVTAQPTKEQVGTAPSCDVETDQDTIILSIRTNGGLDSFTEAATGGPVHATTVGSHQAKQSVGNSRSCIIAIGVTASSRVEVTVTGNGDTDPCPVAQTVAKDVEPNLP